MSDIVYEVDFTYSLQISRQVYFVIVFRNMIILLNENTRFIWDKLSKKAIFSCPGQLNRWPCHSLTHSLTDWVSQTFDFSDYHYNHYNHYNHYRDRDSDLDLDIDWGVVIYNQIVTWTAFAILAMFWWYNGFGLPVYQQNSNFAFGYEASLKFIHVDRSSMNKRHDACINGSFNE